MNDIVLNCLNAMDLTNQNSLNLSSLQKILKIKIVILYLCKTSWKSDEGSEILKLILAATLDSAMSQA